MNFIFFALMLLQTLYFTLVHVPLSYMQDLVYFGAILYSIKKKRISVSFKYQAMKVSNYILCASLNFERLYQKFKLLMSSK